MKFKIFKTATHQRFHIEPRYYDPVKEDIQNRTARIKGELGIQDEKFEPGYRSQIAGSFRKNMKHTPEQVGGNVVILRLTILIVLSIVILGFAYNLPRLFYLLLLFVPFYLWKKFGR